MARKTSEYFEEFCRMAEYGLEAAVFLQQALAAFDADALPARMEELHGIEHKADMENNEMMKKLAKEFVTPIEREDIIEISNALDDVVDKVEDVLIRVYICNVQQIRPAALAFAEVILRCCQGLCKAVEEFSRFHKSEHLLSAIIDVNTLEEEGDALYLGAVHNLYLEGGDATYIMVWADIFDRLEECCDTCEVVADLLELVVLKNS